MADGDREYVLILGAEDRTRTLAGRLVALECRGARAGDAAGALQALLSAPSPIRVGFLSGGHTIPDLGQTLDALGRQAPSGSLSWVVYGPRPDAPALAALRGAGVRFALFEPFTDEELRFVLNQARHDGQDSAVPRLDERVPADLRARVLTKTGEKVALVYNLSSTGAYLVTPRPTLRGGRVEVHFRLPSGDMALAAEVVWNNVPGNLRRGNAPVGMGVRFLDAPEEIRTRLLEYVAARARTYRL
jgi:hypothetical protein